MSARSSGYRGLSAAVGPWNPRPRPLSLCLLGFFVFFLHKSVLRVPSHLAFHRSSKSTLALPAGKTAESGRRSMGTTSPGWVSRAPTQQKPKGPARDGPEESWWRGRGKGQNSEEYPPEWDHKYSVHKLLGQR